MDNHSLPRLGDNTANMAEIIRQTIRQELKPDGSLDRDKVKLIVRKKMEQYEPKARKECHNYSINQIISELKRKGEIPKNSCPTKNERCAAPTITPNKSAETKGTTNTPAPKGKTLHTFNAYQLMAARDLIGSCGDDYDTVLHLIQTVTDLIR